MFSGSRVNPLHAKKKLVSLRQNDFRETCEYFDPISQRMVKITVKTKPCCATLCAFDTISSSALKESRVKTGANAGRANRILVAD